MHANAAVTLLHSVDISILSFYCNNIHPTQNTVSLIPSIIIIHFTLVEMGMYKSANFEKLQMVQINFIDQLLKPHDLFASSSLFKLTAGH